MFQILTHSLTLSFIHFLPFFFPPFTNSVLPSFPSFLLSFFPWPLPSQKLAFWYALLFVLVFHNIESRSILINQSENILLKISSKQASIATVAKLEDSNSQTCFFCSVFVLTEMRQVGSSRGAVTAYPRQLESLIRLAEAHARMRLSSKVENVDVEEARRYFLSRKKSC